MTLPEPDGGSALGFPDHELVGVTTEQNTANLVPAVMLGVRKYLAVDSATAARGGWGAGLQRVFEARCSPGSHDRVELGTDQASIEDIMTSVRARIATAPARGRAWCLGGGTKRHQVALWRLFVERFGAGHTSDVAVYAEPGERKTYVESLSADADGTLRVTERFSATAVGLSVAEILGAFGREGGGTAIGTPMRQLPTPSADFDAEYGKFCADQNYRKQWFGLSAAGPHAPLTSVGGTLGELIDALRVPDVRTKIEAEVASALAGMRARAQPLRAPDFAEKAKRVVTRSGHFSSLEPIWSLGIGDVPGLSERLAQQCLATLLKPVTIPNALNWTPPVPIANPLTHGGSLAIYFEALVAARVARLRDRARFPDGGVNVIVRRVGTVQIEQEHDVLLATSTATLVSLDAKTFDLELKDMNSRLLKTRAAAGRFASFVVVLPYFVEDLDQDWLSSELLELPFRCREFQIPFVVVSSSEHTFWVRRDPATKAIVSAPPGSDDAVQCKTLDAYLAGS